MMGYERTPQTLAIEDMESIKTNLAALDATISKYAINLKISEKRSTYKMGSKAVPFVELALKYATEYPEYCPNYFNVEKFQKNFDFYTQVKGTVENIVLVVEKLTDSYTAVGGDAFGDGRAFYDSAKAAAKANKPGADAIVAELKKAYYRRRPSTTSSATGEVKAKATNDKA
jgi:hypothetical protein